MDASCRAPRGFHVLLRLRLLLRVLHVRRFQHVCTGSRTSCTRLPARYCSPGYVGSLVAPFGIVKASRDSRRVHGLPARACGADAFACYLYVDIGVLQRYFDECTPQLFPMSFAHAVQKQWWTAWKSRSAWMALSTSSPWSSCSASLPCCARYKFFHRGASRLASTACTSSSWPCTSSCSSCELACVRGAVAS